MARSIALTMALVAGCASTADTPAPSTTVAPTTTPPAPTSTTSVPVVASTTSPRLTAPPVTGAPDAGGVVDQGEGMPGQEVTLACIRHWESRNNYRAVSRSGRYRGAYQFDQRTWEGNGGSGDPAAASAEEQDRTAATLLSRRGLAPWPTPARRCA